jgi:PAS domain S-box-containing protein
MAVFNQDLDLRYTWMYQPQLGYTTEQVVGKTDAELLPPEAARQATEIKRRVLESGKGARGEVKAALEDRTIYYDLVVEPLRNVAGQVVGITGASLDITERKRGEEQILKHREFLKNIFESLTHPFYVIDASNHTIVMANPAARLGRITESSKCYTITHGRDKPCSDEHTCPLDEVKKTKKPAIVEHIHYDKDGSARNVEVHGYPIFDNKGNVTQMIEYCLDITERKQAEEVLCENKAQLDLALLSAHMGVWHWDIIENRRYFDDQVCHLLGINPATFTGAAEEFFGAVHPDDRGIIKAALARTIEQNVPYEQIGRASCRERVS